MAFQNDDRLAAGEAEMFGEYLTTFLSNTGQVRADIFRAGRIVIAHVCFPTSANEWDVTDPYVDDLWQYARGEGFADQFKLIYS